MSHTLAYTSQKAKVYLLRGSNNRSKIWQFSKSSTEHCPCGVTIVELSSVRFFMQLPQQNYFMESNSIFTYTKYQAGISCVMYMYNAKLCIWFMHARIKLEKLNVIMATT